MKKIFLLFIFILSLQIAVGAITVSAESGTWGNLKWEYSEGFLIISGKGNMKGQTNNDPFPWNGTLANQITYVRINEGVTSIAGGAFSKLTALTGLNIAETVGAIGNGVFNSNQITISVYEGSYAQSFGPFKTGQFTIDVLPKKSTTNTQVTLSPTSYSYDGSEKKPTVTVQYQDAVLRSGVDYTVAYSNNKNVGTGSVTVTGAGNYIGEKTANFTISKGDLSAASVSVSPSSYVYDGNAKTPAVTVKMGNKTLTAGTDYSVQYTNNTNAGTATVTVTGAGNYTGTKAASFTISQADLSQSSVSPSPTSYTYDGSAKTPTVTVKMGNKTLTAGTDYSIQYSDNTNVGTASVTLTGAGNYTGTKTASFTISKADLSQASVSLSPTRYTYDGSAKTPTVTVKLGNTTLQAGTDYTVQYENNKSVGTATVTVTGKGNYTGTAKATFKIKPAPTPTPKPVEEITVSGGVYKLNLKKKTAFFKKSTDKNATSIKIPATVKANGKTYKVTEIAQEACKGMNKLEEVTIGKNVQVIELKAFNGCISLKKIKLGDNLQNIEREAFEGCIKLSTVTIGAGLKEIGSYAFKGCVKLSKLTIGAGLKEIHKEAFWGCSKLKTIKIKSKKLTSIGENAFKIYYKAKFYVPSNKITKYEKMIKDAGARSTVEVKALS